MYVSYNTYCVSGNIDKYAYATVIISEICEKCRMGNLGGRKGKGKVSTMREGLEETTTFNEERRKEYSQSSSPLGYVLTEAFNELLGKLEVLAQVAQPETGVKPI